MNIAPNLLLNIFCSQFMYTNTYLCGKISPFFYPVAEAQQHMLPLIPLTPQLSAWTAKKKKKPSLSLLHTHLPSSPRFFNAATLPFLPLSEGSVCLCARDAEIAVCLTARTAKPSAPTAYSSSFCPPTCFHSFSLSFSLLKSLALGIPEII